MKKIYSLFILFFMMSISAVWANNSNKTDTISHNKIAYIINSTSGNSASLFKCNINPNDMTFSDDNGLNTCKALDSASIGSDTNGAASWLYAHSITISGNYLFVLTVTSSGSSWVQSCPINSDGTISKCVDVYNAKTYKARTILAVRLMQGSYLYVGNGNEEIRRLTIDDTTGMLTDNGDVYNGNDNGNYIQTMFYDAEAGIMLFSNGPSSTRSYFLKELILNSDGSVESSVTLKELTDTKYKEDGVVVGHILYNPSAIMIVGTEMYLSIINLFDSDIDSTSEESSEILVQNSESRFNYKNTGQSLVTGLNKVIGSNMHNYLYSNYSNGNVYVCDITDSPYSNSNCIPAGFGNSTNLIIN